VGNLIKARSRQELDVLLELCTPDFIQVHQQHGEEERQLTRWLAKVGLVMENDGIHFADLSRTRWR
jgi:hypothetical protein